MMISSIRAAEIVTAWRVDPLARWSAIERQARFDAHAWRRNTHTLAGEVETIITHRLEALGYVVASTPHRAPYDLVVNHRLKIEVKASHWHKRRDRPTGGRYSARIKRTQRRAADLFIIACKNEIWHFFIIPAEALATSLFEINSYHVEDYTGKYAAYLEAWAHVSETLANEALASAAGRAGRQLELLERYEHEQ